MLQCMKKEVQILLKNLDSRVDFNPWAVQDASKYLRYCCPECDHQCLYLDKFKEHALKNHERAVTLFRLDTKVSSLKRKLPAHNTNKKKRKLKEDCDNDIFDEDDDDVMAETIEKTNEHGYNFSSSVDAPTQWIILPISCSRPTLHRPSLPEIWLFVLEIWPLLPDDIIWLFSLEI